MPTILEACPEYDSIGGWLSIEEADYLYRAAARIANGVIVEVGSANGRSTIALSLGARAGSGTAVFAIEPHERFVGVYGGQFGPENRRAFFETMLRFGGWENTRLINVSSEVVGVGWRLPIGLLWIDGDHRYDAVRRDSRCGGHISPRRRSSRFTTRRTQPADRTGSQRSVSRAAISSRCRHRV